MSVIHCPKCRDTVEAKVKDSRPGEFSGTATTRRTRKCASCGQVFSTIEVDEATAKKMLRAREALNKIIGDGPVWAGRLRLLADMIEDA